MNLTITPDSRMTAATLALPSLPAFEQREPPPEKRSPPLVNKKLITDFPLDYLRDRLCTEGIINEHGIVKPNADRMRIPALWEGQINLLRKRLNTPLPFKIKRQDTTEVIMLPLKRILKILGQQNYLVGSYLHVLLGSEWYSQYLNILLKTSESSSLLLKHLDKATADLDFRSYVENDRQQPAHHAEAVIKYLAEQLKTTNKDAELCDHIRKRGGTFKEFHPLFCVNNGKIANDSFLITYDDEQGLEVDLLIARVLSSDLLSIQNLRMHIQPLIDEGDNAIVNPLLVPEANEKECEQAMIDVMLLQYHFLSYHVKAWTKSIVAITDRYRHPSKIPKEVPDNLHLHCEQYDTLHQAILPLLKRCLMKHYREEADAAVALAYNACISLNKSGFNSSDINQLWTRVSNLMTPGKEKITHSKLSLLYGFSQFLPFDALTSIVEILKFLELCEVSANRDMERDCDFLIIHDDAPAITSKMGNSSLLIPFRPAASCAKIVKLAQSSANEIICNFLKAWNTDFHFSDFKHSPVHHHFTADDLRMPKMAELGQSLLALPAIELKILGYRIVFHCYAFTHSMVLFKDLLTYSIEIFSSLPVNSCQNLIQWIKNTIPRHFPVADLSYIKFLYAASNTPDQRYAALIKLLLPDSFSLALAFLKTRPQLLSREHNLVGILFENLSHIKNMQSVKDDIRQLIEISSQNIACSLLNKDEMQHLIVKLVEVLIQRNRPRLAGVVLYEATKSKLVMEYELWLKCFEKIYNSQPHNIPEGVQFWLWGTECGIWNQIARFNEEPKSLLDFIDSLIQAESLEHQAIARKALSFITKASIRPFSSRIIELLDRLHEKDQKYLQLQENIIQEENAIRTFLKDSESHWPQNMRKLVNSLIVNLLTRKQTHEHEKINLMACRKLLSEPLIHKVYKDQAEEFFGHILNCMEAFVNSEIEDNLKFLGSLWDLPFKTVFCGKVKPLAASPCLRYLSLIVQVARCESHHGFPQSLKSNLYSCLPRFLGMIKNSNSPHLMCRFIRSLMMEGMHSNLTVDVFLEFIAWSAYDILENQAYRTNKELFLDCVEMLKAAPAYPPVTKSQEQLQAYIRLAKGLMAARCYLPLMEIFKKIANLKDRNDIKQIQSMAHLYLKWIHELVTEEAYELAAFLLDDLENESHHVFQEIYSTMLELPDEMLQHSSYTLAKILKAMPMESPMPSAAISKAYFLIRQLLKPTSQERYGLLALDLTEKYVSPLEQSMFKILEYSLAANNIHIKERAWRIYQAKMGQMELPCDWLLDDNLSGKWIASWRTALKILRTVCIKTHRPAFLHEMRHQIMDVFKTGTPLNDLMEKMPRTLSYQPLKELLESGLSSINNPSSCKKDIGNLLKLRDTLFASCSKDAKQLVDPEARSIDMLMADHLINSGHVPHMLPGGKLIMEMLKIKSPKDVSMLVGLISDLFKVTAKEDQALIEKELKMMDSMLHLLIELKVDRLELQPLAKTVGMHPACSKIGSAAKLLTMFPKPEPKVKEKKMINGLTGRMIRLVARARVNKTENESFRFDQIIEIARLQWEDQLKNVYFRLLCAFLCASSLYLSLSSLYGICITKYRYNMTFTNSGYIFIALTIFKICLFSYWLKCHGAFFLNKWSSKKGIKAAV